MEKLDGSVTPFTMVNIGGPFAVKGMMSNPISSPQYWKPSTFGGDVGFDIIKTASIEKLFCQNMKPGECRNVGFRLPRQTVQESAPSTHIAPSFSPAVGASTNYRGSIGSSSASIRSLPVNKLELIDSIHECMTDHIQLSHRNHCTPRELRHF